jgi:hypothetical protein
LRLDDSQRAFVRRASPDGADYAERMAYGELGTIANHGSSLPSRQGASTR